MYQIITQTWINGDRKADSIYPKVYAKKGFAERRAKSLEFKSDHITKKAYARKLPIWVSEEKAKEVYCKGRNVYVDGNYGIELLTPAGWYGSHAPATELFYRGVNHCCGYYKQYDGNYYIEDED